MSTIDTDAALWSAVDAYLEERLTPKDAALEAALVASSRAGLPHIQVTPLQGPMLHIFARMSGARRILEIGTLGGYSTIWLARALPQDGHLITLEAEPKHAAVARRNIGQAALADRVEIREGPALETLPLLVAEGAGPFDFIFLDADKQNNAAYLAWALRLSRPGTVIVTDNVVREGALLDAESDDPAIQGTRRFFDALAADSRLTATAIQTVSDKKYDGFALIIVNSL